MISQRNQNDQIAKMLGFQGEFNMKFEDKMLICFLFLRRFD